MAVLIVNGAQVRRLLPMGECMTVMADALAALSRGDAMVPMRQIMWLPEKVGALALMPSYAAHLQAMGVKVVSAFPGNHGTPYDAHQGAVLVFETTHVQLVAMVDASAITAIRTAAISGVATQLLARPDAQSLAILGSGVQAASHLDAMVAARHHHGARLESRHGARKALRQARR